MRQFRFPLHSRDHQRECNVHDRSRKRRMGRTRKRTKRRSWRRERGISHRVTELYHWSFSEMRLTFSRAPLFLLINIGQCCRRNNAAVKQQSAIKSGYRKCYRTTRIVFCGEQKYWIFYNAIKRSQMITMRWSVRGRRGEGGGGRERREVNNEARRFVGLQPRRAVSTPLGPIDRRSDKSFSWAEKTTVPTVVPSSPLLRRFPPPA